MMSAFSVEAYRSCSMAIASGCAGLDHLHHLFVGDVETSIVVSSGVTARVGVGKCGHTVCGLSLAMAVPSSFYRENTLRAAVPKCSPLTTKSCRKVSGLLTLLHRARTGPAVAFLLEAREWCRDSIAGGLMKQGTTKPDYLGIGFEMMERDLRFLLECFAEVLTELGHADLAAASPLARAKWRRKARRPGGWGSPTRSPFSS